MRFTFNAAVAAVCVLFLACVAFGAPPEIVELSPVPKQADPKPVTIPDTLSVGKYRWLGIAGYDGVVTWQVDSVAAITFETDSPTKLIGVVEGQTAPTLNDVPAKSLVLYGKAEGVTRVEAWGVVEGRAKRLASKVFGGADPPPDEDQKKGDDTNPPVVAKKLFIAVVEDPNARSADTAILAASQAYWDSLQAAGDTYRWYIDTTTELDAQKHLAAVKGTGRPALLIKDAETGKQLFVGPLPKTLDELKTTVAKYKGK